MQRTRYAQPSTNRNPFPSTILSTIELYQALRTPELFATIDALIEDRNDIRSHLHYFTSLNRTIDSLQQLINEHRGEMQHVFNDIMRQEVVQLIAPEILYRMTRPTLRRRRRPTPYPSTSSSSDEYYSTNSSLTNPSNRYHNNEFDLNEPVIPINTLSSNSSPGSSNNPIDVDTLPHYSADPPLCDREGHENCDIGNPLACLSCHRLGHDFADCPVEPIDFSLIDNSISTRAGQANQSTSSTATDQHQRDMRGRLLLTCGNCSRTGHSAIECFYTSAFRCSLCHNRGHIARNCVAHRIPRRRTSAEEARVWNPQT